MVPLSVPVDIGGYTLLGELARGGVGDVFLARRATGGFRRRAVVKILRHEVAATPDLRDRVLFEVGQAAQLDHTNVVRVLEVGEDANRYFWAMEFVDGSTLARALSALRVKRRLLSATTAAHVVLEACAGLDHAHDLCDDDGLPVGLVHGSLAPETILLGYAGVIKVFGFGTAGARAVAPRPGTPESRLGFTAPETFEGAPASRRTDIYALGVILYRAALGVLPFRGDSDAAVMRSVLQGDAAIPQGLAPDFPSGLQDVVLRAMSRNPEERFATVAEMSEELERCLQGTSRAVASAELKRLLEELFPAASDGERLRVRRMLDEGTDHTPPARATPSFPAAAAAERLGQVRDTLATSQPAPPRPSSVTLPPWDREAAAAAVHEAAVAAAAAATAANAAVAEWEATYGSGANEPTVVSAMPTPLAREPSRSGPLPLTRPTAPTAVATASAVDDSPPRARGVVAKDGAPPATARKDPAAELWDALTDLEKEFSPKGK